MKGGLLRISGRNALASWASVCPSNPVPTLPNKAKIFPAIGAEQKCSPILPRPGWSCKSADDKLLFLVRLDLEPFPGTAFFIRTIAVLGHYSFKPFALGDRVSGKAVTRQAARKKQLPWWLSYGGF